MLKLTAIRSGWCLMALALSACTVLKQPPVATEAANDSDKTVATANNPYGTAPYTPPATDAPPYVTANNGVPPVSASYPIGSTYVPNYAPVDMTAASYTVQRGDTVFNIAKRFQINQNDLRSWNNIIDNNVKIGQTLRVKPLGYVAPTRVPQPAAVNQPAPVAVTTAPVSTPAPAPVAAPIATPAPVSTPVITTPAPATVPTDTKTLSTTKIKQAVAKGSVRNVSGIEWQFPTNGNILQTFNVNTKGIDFGGKAGQPIWAAADGKVVYAGSGLRGYGNLIIIQHNQVYLTAYGHNQNLMVTEGQQVKRGQQIATMGSSDAKSTQLHFELRENGTPKDPELFLP